MSQYLKFDTEVYKSLHVHVTKEENDQLIIEAKTFFLVWFVSFCLLLGALVTMFWVKSLKDLRA